MRLCIDSYFWGSPNDKGAASGPHPLFLRPSGATGGGSGARRNSGVCGVLLYGSRAGQLLLQEFVCTGAARKYISPAGAPSPALPSAGCRGREHVPPTYAERICRRGSCSLLGWPRYRLGNDGGEPRAAKVGSVGNTGSVGAEAN